MADSGEEEGMKEGKKSDIDPVGDWLFAHDLSTYAGQWIAAIPGHIIAHGKNLREVYGKVVASKHVEGARFYAVSGELQVT